MSWTEPVKWGLLALVTGTSWACSGTYGACHPALWALVALLAVLTGAAAVKADAAVCRRLLTDPLFVCGVLFSCFLVVQWRNAGGEPFVNIFTGQLSYTPPPQEHWPFSVEARLSRQQLLWFIPPVLFLPAVRHLFSRAQCKVILRALLLNAALLAGFGLIQYGLGWTKLFGFLEVPGRPHILASFDYPNHAGTFFYLLFAASLGLLWDTVEKKKPLPDRALPGALVLLFGITAFFSFSRAAVVAVVAIALFAQAALLWHRGRKLSASHWVNTALAAGAVSVILALGVVRIGNGAVLREFKNTGVIANDLLDYQSSRGFQIPPAIAMVKAHPWFGVGGWGYPKFVRAYLPREQWSELGIGKANVHCDPVQFLAEHGIVGFSLMSVALAALLWPWRKFNQWRFKGLALMAAAGCGLVFLHSFIDLPFRNPTVLWHWLLLLALVPALSGREQIPIKARVTGEAQTR